MSRHRHSDIADDHVRNVDRQLHVHRVNRDGVRITGDELRRRLRVPHLSVKDQTAIAPIGLDGVLTFVDEAKRRIGHGAVIDVTL